MKDSNCHSANLYSYVMFSCSVAGTVLLALVFAMPYSHSLVLRQHSKAKGKHARYQTTGTTACTSFNKNGQVTDTGLGLMDRIFGLSHFVLVKKMRNIYKFCEFNKNIDCSICPAVLAN